MQTNIEAEIERLKSRDPTVYNKAFESLTTKGPVAVPALMELLESKSDEGRILAAAALATIADPASADIVFQYTSDRESKVRAWSAVALQRMKDDRALPALLKNIDDYQDELHNDQTLVTYALIQRGETVLLPLIDLLNSSKWETRRHAFSVLQKVILNKMKAKGEWDKIWVANGSYNAADEEAARVASMERWRQWIRENISEE